MGGKSSATKGKPRKSNDRIELSPVSRGAGGGGGAGGTGGAATCPLAFEVLIPASASVATGTRLTLRKNDSGWSVVAVGKEVVALRKDKSTMLDRCTRDGYRYSGKAVIRSKQTYGEFQRSD